MQPKPITRYSIYWSASDVPFDDCDADWHYEKEYSDYDDAKFYMKRQAAKYTHLFWTILEEVTERKIVYTEVENA